ncbi:MAG: amphi-Trp domain-containing protein [Desulfovibrio sp.]|jgi:amphi-Trp domain-containing protein|nr:amphi-Trp domain-containing protein [Desulfovibrio sp.]
MAKRELEISTRLTREDVAGIVEDLIEGLKDGCLKVHKGGEYLQLDVPRVVDLKVESDTDEVRAGLRIEVSWRTGSRANPDNVPDEPPAKAPGKGAGARRSASPAKGGGKRSKSAASGEDA